MQPRKLAAFASSGSEAPRARTENMPHAKPEIAINMNPVGSGASRSGVTSKTSPRAAPPRPIQDKNGKRSPFQIPTLSIES